MIHSASNNHSCQQSQQPNMGDLRYLVDDYMPDAIFMSGGGLRSGRALRTLNGYLKSFVGCRSLSAVLDVMPCQWSLDWSPRASILTDQIYEMQLNRYASAATPFGLCFDNPFLSQDMLADTYSWALIDALVAQKVVQNVVCVAHDGLRDLLRQRYPKLPIYAHQNRAIAEMGRRDARFYNQLTERYDKVLLHPADGGRMDLIKTLNHPEKVMIVVNDPCLRTCPVRRDHLRLLAARRKEPFNLEHRLHINKLIQSTACMDPKTLLAGQSSNLSRAQLRKLYDAGIRHFVFQSQRFEQMTTLLTDIMNTLFTDSPLHSHQVSTIQANFFGMFSQEKRELKPGLNDFDLLS